MKYTSCMAALVFVVLAAACAPAPQTGNTPPAGGQMPQSVIGPYLDVQSALSQDNMDIVATSAGNIATASSMLGAPAVKIDMAAIQLAGAGDLAAARDRFGTLSEAIVDYMDGLHLTPPAGVRVAFCPMKLKPWLQQGTTLANPYFGTEMPTCGAFR